MVISIWNQSKFGYTCSIFECYDQWFDWLRSLTPHIYYFLQHYCYYSHCYYPFWILNLFILVIWVPIDTLIGVYLKWIHVYLHILAIYVKIIDCCFLFNLYFFLDEWKSCLFYYLNSNFYCDHCSLLFWKYLSQELNQ